MSTTSFIFFPSFYCIFWLFEVAEVRGRFVCKWPFQSTSTFFNIQRIHWSFDQFIDSNILQIVRSLPKLQFKLFQEIMMFLKFKWIIFISIIPKSKFAKSESAPGPLWLIRGAMILNFYNYLVLLHLELTIYTLLYLKKIDELWKKSIRFSFCLSWNLAISNIIFKERNIFED